MKRALLALWSLPSHIRFWIGLGHWLGNRLPLIGLPLSMIVDRVLFTFYSLDAASRNVFVPDLQIGHPVGVLLGGNGIRSRGTLVVNAGAKFVGRAPDDPEYLARHAEKRVFDLGDNIVIGTNSVVIGPVTICDNVVVGAMSLVNKDITEPGTYVGCPVRKVSDDVSLGWGGSVKAGATVTKDTADHGQRA